MPGQIIIGFDILIIITAFWALMKLMGYGGPIGKSFKMIGIGIFIMGIAQIVETTGILLFTVEMSTMEILHRVFMLLGIILIVAGFQNLMKKNEKVV